MVDRLVFRVQRQLQSAEAAASVEQIVPLDRALLAARLERLQQCGEQFQAIRLSGFVARGCVAGIGHRVGGVCVATDR